MTIFLIVLSAASIRRSSSPSVAAPGHISSTPRDSDHARGPCGTISRRLRTGSVHRSHLTEEDPLAPPARRPRAGLANPWAFRAGLAQVGAGVGCTRRSSLGEIARTARDWCRRGLYWRACSYRGGRPGRGVGDQSLAARQAGRALFHADPSSRRRLRYWLSDCSAFSRSLSASARLARPSKADAFRRTWTPCTRCMALA